MNNFQLYFSFEPIYIFMNKVKPYIDEKINKKRPKSKKLFLKYVWLEGH